MNIFALIRRESQSSFSLLLLAVITSGVANALLLAAIHQLLSNYGQNRIIILWLAIFIGCVLIFYYAKRYLLHRSTILMEKVVSDLRKRISDKVRKSELRVIEDVGSADIYARITQDANLISQSAAFIINALQSAIMIVACMFYLAYLSPIAFLLIAISISLSFIYYMRRQQKIRGDIQAMFEKETEFFGSLEEIISGIKELKLHHKKNVQVFSAFETLAEEAQAIKTRTGFHYVYNMTFSQMFFYMLIGATALLMPFLTEDTVTSYAIVTALLFIIGPIETIVSSVQVFTKANMAAKNIHHLEETLTNFNTVLWPENPLKVRPLRFQSIIRYEDLTFTYTENVGESSFNVGPMDFEVRKGEILMLVGGNGSGKSTLLKIISGLYLPDSGRITVDDQMVGDKNYATYRELFSAVFTDFHLFRKLYGTDRVSPTPIDQYLKMFGIDHKTTFASGQFTQLNLSTGQRKRLALIASILDDKPIFVFDEVASDQDPAFRKFFYEEFIQDLRAQDKTIILVSHDDRYFHVADRVIKMEYGQMVAEVMQ